MSIAPAAGGRRPFRRPAVLLLSTALCLAVAGQVPMDEAHGVAAQVAGLDLRLLGQAGGKTQALAVEPSRGLVFLGAGRAVTVMKDGGRDGLSLLGRGQPLDDVVAGLTAGGQWLAAWTDSGDGLTVMDTSDAARPVITSRLQNLAGPVTYALRDGDRLYLALGRAGLATYQLGAAGPEALSLLPLPGWSRHLAVAPINGRRMVFVALGSAGLAAVDVEDGAQPTVISSIAGIVEGVAAWGSLAYLAQREALPGGGDGATRLAIYDLSRPAQPRRIVEPRPDFSVGPRPVTDGVLLYSCAGNPPHLEPIDVRSPQQPVRRGFLTVPPIPARWLQCAAAATNGARVYLASWSGGVEPAEDRHGGIAVFQRQASSRLAFQQSLNLRGNVSRLLIDGRGAWLTDGAAAGTPSTGLRDVDISDPERPLLRSRYSLEPAPLAGAPGTPTPFAPAGDIVAGLDYVHAATAGRYHRLERAGNGLVPESQLALPASASSDPPPRMVIWKDGLVLAVAGTDPGHLLRLTMGTGGPPAIARQGDLRRSGLVTDLAQGTAGLLATVRQGGLRLLDPDPEAVDADWERASLALPAESLAIETDGALAFIANGDAGLIAVDLQDPLAPVDISRSLWSDGPDAAAAAVDLAIDRMAEWNGGRRGLVILEQSSDLAAGRLRLVDAADPRQPRSLLSLTIPVARALAVAGDLVYLASEDEVLEVYRISGLAPSPVPSASPSPTPSPSTSPGPTMTPTMTPSVPSSPTPTVSPSDTATAAPTDLPSPPVATAKVRQAWLPILSLRLYRRRELTLLWDSHPSDGTGDDRALRLELARLTLADALPAFDSAALLSFDSQRATIEVVGSPAMVAGRLPLLGEAPGRGSRLDLALAGVDSAAAILPPPPERRDRVVLIVAGPSAASAGSPAGRAAALRRLGALRDAGVRVFVLENPGDSGDDWAQLLGRERTVSRADPATARARVADWSARGWW